MKTSVIDVDDMLSVWSAEEVERRLGEVPGVESVAVNYAAESTAACSHNSFGLLVGPHPGAPRLPGPGVSRIGPALAKIVFVYGGLVFLQGAWQPRAGGNLSRPRRPGPGRIHRG